MRRVTYRTAINAFVFTAFWLVIGGIVVWSPLPGKLGIGGGFITAYVVLFFLLLAASGALLTVAAINGVFPPTGSRPVPRAPRPAQPNSSSAQTGATWPSQPQGAPTPAPRGPSRRA